MVNLYFILIKNKLKALSDVPTDLQAAVQTKLTAAGLDSNGNQITPVSKASA